MISFREWLKLTELDRIGDPSSADDEERDGWTNVFRLDAPLYGTIPSKEELPPVKHKCNKAAKEAVASMNQRNASKKK